MNKLLSANEMKEIQKWKTPNDGRDLINNWWKQSYEYQLDLDVQKLVDSLLDKKDIKILDICINHSDAIFELKKKILSDPVNNSKNIQLSWVDLQKIEKDTNEIEISQWNLEDNNFLELLEWKLWNQSQNTIFMNQWTQYLSDRLKVLQFVLENLLIEGWEFHFNLIDDYFMVWNNSYPWQFVDELERKWKKCNGFSFTKTTVSYDNGPNSSVYHFKKEKRDAKILMPYFRKSETNNFWYVTSWYSFIEPI